ncbi:MAG: bifunctional UDP-N-acetylglucosamine diphosphorylase/glucosamine-1-phosphate N-acetyltransferase GlmU [Xanthobacteraceae bacterium]|nr:bifunctional UDP-N-acetylglucosamine diphosphorylase/glucosamine-1-phosphate N-acetyltransferase GlmU [Xanthobacteraceae bacterium]MCW5674823.1 bifunctional UDP-N-acetylglucosamine diphosphorylase/glucosamine-1-phosphate N-acetyltransferase GlmU [Xanthobacteraceae bacterium]
MGAGPDCESLGTIYQSRPTRPRRASCGGGHRLNRPTWLTRRRSGGRTHPGRHFLTTNRILILAAGEGTRMRSALPKVLHKVGGRSLIGHVLAAANASGASAIDVVIGPEREDVAAEVKKLAPSAGVFVQRERLGTAHAVLQAKAALGGGDNLIVAFGDTPLLRAETFAVLGEALEDAAVAVLGFRPKDPHGYGRLVEKDGNLVAIREEKDASDDEKKIGLCNAGIMAFSGKHALSLIEAIGNENAKREFYLTDAVALARAKNLNVTVREAPEEEVMGINDRAQLAEAEAELQKRMRKAALENGVTLAAPETVFFSADTKLGKDVTIEPNVVFGPGVVVKDGATIKAFSHLEGAEVGEGASVGPFARLRPGTRLGAKSKIGNFVEVKAATFGDGAKANHLSYVGDASVGANANIGAGTITCNYDGYDKHKTEIGEGAFIGSNSALVAPVKIGKGAYVGTGSVVTDDVPADALAVARGRQAVKEGWAAEVRKTRGKAKKHD